MNLKEIFSDTDTLIFKVTNFFDVAEESDWTVEKTSWQLIPNDKDYEGYLMVKGYLISAGKIIKECFIDICVPERDSEFAFLLEDGELKIKNVLDDNLKTIPAMASELYGDPELYFIKDNPRIGIDILKAGKKIAVDKSAIIDDLAYIYEELGQNRKKIKIVDANAMLQKFIQSSISHTKLLAVTDFKLPNKHYRIMADCVQYLKENGQLKTLLPLLENSNFGTRLWAASFLLENEEEKAIAALKHIIEANIPHISLSAASTLENWQHKDADD